MTGLIDISRALCPETPVYSAEDGFSRDVLHTVAQDQYNLSRLHMGAHCGTHMDAPAHFLSGGAAIDAVPLGLLIGEAVVAEVSDGRELSALAPCTRLLIKARDAFGLSPAQAQALIDLGVRLVGTDQLSIAPSSNEAEVHRMLLSAGVWIVEMLDLSRVQPGRYGLYCLPLRIKDCEGAPVRALLRTCHEE